MEFEKYLWLSLFVASNSLLLLALAMNVSRLRVKADVSLGDGGNKQLMVAIRTHSNGIEQVPIFTFAILILTLQESAFVTLACFSIGFTLTRLLHAFGMLCRVVPARRVAAGLSYLFQVTAVGFIFVQALA